MTPTPTPTPPPPPRPHRDFTKPTHRYRRIDAPVRIVDATPGWRGVSRYNPAPPPNSEPEYGPNAGPYGGCHHVRVDHNALILIEFKVGDRWMRRPLHPDELEELT